MTSASTIAAGVPAGGTIAPGDVDVFRLESNQGGRLTARMDASEVGTSLALLDSRGRLLVQSDQISPGDDYQIDQHVTEGTYYFEVSRRHGAGHYTLSAGLESASPPFQGLGSGEGTPPIALVPGDFNADGKQDLATANYRSGDVSVLLGRGGGTFGEPVRFAVGALPIAIAAGDFDGDRRLDLATANAGSDDVSVLWGDGNGSFREGARYSVGDSPLSIVAVDLNGDGRLDLATANAGSGDISVLRGRGDGSFGDQARYMIGVGALPSDIAVGDFDGNGRLDLAVANGGPGSVSVLLDSADGSYQTLKTFAAGSGAISIAAGDFDGDGLLDLATTNFTSGEVSVLRGKGGGLFRDQVRFAVESPVAIVAGDFDRKGGLDLATASTGSGDVSVLLGDEVSVLMGNGNGSIEPRRFATGSGPLSLAAGDFDGDGRLDLATPNLGSGDVSVLRGRGDGSFFDSMRFAAGDSPQAIVAGDFDGDGHLDLATASTGSNDVSVFLGGGDGSFGVEIRSDVGHSPMAIAAGDFNRDGYLDLATANAGSGDVSMLLGRGDGKFRVELRFAVGMSPQALVAGDFNRDGRLDLATANGGSGDVSLLLGRGDGSFRPEERFAAGDAPQAVVAGDFNGDGRPDLAIANINSGDVSVLLGRGDGRFLAPMRFAVGRRLRSIVTGDFNGDGYLDLVTASFGSDDGSVLLGHGDGRFLAPNHFATGSGPLSLGTGDFDRDGRLDLVTANFGSDDGAVLPGRGDGTFLAPKPFATGTGPLSIAVADLDGDGHLDLATANSGSGDATVLRGRGDGSFQYTERFGVGAFPRSIVAGDFNRDALTDLATANYDSDDVSVLLGRGDGTFRTEVRFAAGDRVQSIVAGDFNGDGRLDLATANSGSNDVSVLLGPGDGSFFDAVHFRVGKSPQSIAAFDLNNDGHTDLAVTDASGGSVLLGRGDGMFFDAVPAEVPRKSQAIAVADFDNDFLPDLAVANFGSEDVSVVLSRSVLLGIGLARVAAGMFLPSAEVGDFNGNGRLDPDDISAMLALSVQLRINPVRFAVGTLPLAIAVGDFNGDGRLDLAAANAVSDDVSVALNFGGDRFENPGRFTITPRATPLVADLERDGTDDVLVINRDGEILWRKGRPHESGTFEPPLSVNPGVPSRDIAVVDSRQGILIASVGARDNMVSLFALRNGQFVPFGNRLPAGFLPAQIATADLDGDSHSDLVVRNAGDGSASIYLGDGSGNFIKRPDDLLIGLGASDILLADVDQSRAIDLVVTNQSTGDVRVLFNGGDAPFTRESRYRAGKGLYGLVIFNDTPTLQGLEETAGVAVGTFTTGGFPGLATLNPGSYTFAILEGLEGGAFANPRPIPTGRPAQVIRSADFNGDDVSDVVLLQSGGLRVYLGDGQGGFSTTTFSINSGPDDTGLTVAYVNGDRRLDLLVGNHFGDVLVLLGNGDGTFGTNTQVDPGVDLVVADLNGDRFPDQIVATPSLDRVSITYRTHANRHTPATRQTIVRNQLDGLRTPRAVALADLDRDGRPDLIVANSGNNNILIYPGLGNGQFDLEVNGGEGFFTGTNPVGITVADVDNDGRLDLVVANQGSNDVSILLGRGRGSDWTLVRGPRLRAGTGPRATVVQDFDNDGWLDILVSNSLSNDVRLIPGVGSGFFNDQSVTPIRVGINPGPLFVGDFDGRFGLDFITINQGFDLTLVSGFAGENPSRSDLSSGGTFPLAGLSDDFNGDGMSDLVVANKGDGQLAFFLGGGEGLSLSQILRRPDLPHPTALALNAFGNGVLSFFAATEGEETARLVSLTFGGGATQQIAQLVPLRPEAQALVATLLTVVLDMSLSAIYADAAASPIGAELLATFSNSTVPPAQGVSQSEIQDQSATQTDAKKQPDDAREDVSEEEAPPWIRFY